MEAHRKIASAYDDINKQRINLQNRLERLQEQYEWGHKSKDDYLDKYTQIRHKLDILTPPETDTRMLNRFAHFLESVPDAWEAATQEQRNRLASELFEDVIVEHNRVVGVKPKAELKPFFQLSYEEHQKYHKRPRWGSTPLMQTFLLNSDYSPFLCSSRNSRGKISRYHLMNGPK